MKTSKQSDFNDALAKMDRAYEAGDSSWFDFLSDDVIIYTTNSAEPIKGKKEYTKHFKKALTSNKRKVEQLARNIQDLGEISIVYNTVQIRQEDVVVNLKQSQVWSRKRDGWKVNHIHSALVGSPFAANPQVDKLGSIKVINEKIASMAAVLGVAQ